MRRKIKLGSWFDGAFRLLAALRGLRGTALDPFGYAEVRRVERELIGEYRALIEKSLVGLSPESYERAVKLAGLPDLIRGYEDIKLRNVKHFRDEVRAQVDEGARLALEWPLPEPDSAGEGVFAEAFQELGDGNAPWSYWRQP